MLRRLVAAARNVGSKSAAEERPCEEVEQANSALNLLKEELKQQSSASDGSSQDRAPTQLARWVQCCLAIPRNEDRTNVVDAFAATWRVQVASMAGHPGVSSLFDRVLRVLLIAVPSEEVSEAICAILTSLQDDEELLRYDSVLQSCEVSEEGDIPTKLGVRLMEASTSQKGSQRCEDLLAERCGTLAKAAERLAQPKEAVQVKETEANRKSQELTAQLRSLREDAAKSDPLEKDLLDLEDGMDRLQKRKAELKAELERLSSQHSEALQRQREVMRLVDVQHAEQDRAKREVVEGQQQLARKQAATDEEKAFCVQLSDFLRKVEEQLTILGDRDPEVQQRLTSKELQDAAARVVAAIDARLEAALAAANEAHERHVRAKETMELMSVEAPSSLPTKRDLQDALSTLRDAWASRSTLGSADLRKRSEIEEFLREAHEEGMAGESMADLKSSWAQRWGEMGDSALFLANATAGSRA